MRKAKVGEKAGRRDKLAVMRDLMEGPEQRDREETQGHRCGRTAGTRVQKGVSRVVW